MSERGFPALGTRILPRPPDEFSPLSGESGIRGLGAGRSRTLGIAGGQTQAICQTLVAMFVRALVDDIKRHDSRRRFPPGADVNIDLCRPFFRRDLYVIPVFVLAVRRLVWENGVNGDALAQAFSYPLHLQSAGGRFGSDLEGGLGSFNQRRRNGPSAWYGEGVRKRYRWWNWRCRRAYWG